MKPIDIDLLFSSGALQGLEATHKHYSAMNKAIEFWTVYREYRRFHGVRYALRRALHIAVQGSPF